jgi:hypothetical protein
LGVGEVIVTKEMEPEIVSNVKIVKCNREIRRGSEIAARPPIHTATATQTYFEVEYLALKLHA